MNGYEDTMAEKHFTPPEKTVKKLSEEDTSKVMMSDLPEQSEYSPVLYAAQDVGKLVNTDFDKCQEANRKAWSGIQCLMAGCIARGMRLAKADSICELDENQELPNKPHPWSPEKKDWNSGYYQSQKDMVEAGYRKIKKRDGPCGKGGI